MSENTNEYSTKHPHEPEIPATYDDEGRCLICGLLVQVAQLEEENEALVKIVAQSSHEEHCYAENWWDSSCDCGLMDLVLQLSPRLQNALDDERKSWEVEESECGCDPLDHNIDCPQRS